MTAPRNALLVVERDFLVQHVGVRRVILHYWRALEAAGSAVTLATPDGGGGLVAGEARLLPQAAGAGASMRPSWTSRRASMPLATDEPTTPTPPATVIWGERRVSPANADVMLLTAPWICEQPIPSGENTLGIVYDMVPNLLALGVLRFPTYLDVCHFAALHDAGYRHYLANARRILCISGSTERDFRRFYPATEGRTLVDIPFSMPPAMLRRPAKAPTILLVNALDHRKNLIGIVQCLTLLSGTTPFVLKIVGRERVPLHEVLDLLGRLAGSGIDVEWYRDASDATLHALYAEASILLFPSIYEGLGLPILEAQGQGLPVLSSDTSSCPEINLNSALLVPLVPEEISTVLREVLEGRRLVLDSEPLRLAQADFLAAHQHPVSELFV
jgi:glycosyltransferase involved in cell wall biosynthesis